MFNDLKSFDIRLIFKIQLVTEILESGLLHCPTLFTWLPSILFLST